jgi:hypothetical protein
VRSFISPPPGGLSFEWRRVAFGCQTVREELKPGLEIALRFTSATSDDCEISARSAGASKLAQRSNAEFPKPEPLHHGSECDSNKGRMHCATYHDRMKMLLTGARHLISVVRHHIHHQEMENNQIGGVRINRNLEKVAL